MPILGGLLAGLFGGVFNFFVQFVTRKTALAMAWITTFATLTSALVAAVASAAGALSASAPSIPGVASGFYGMAADIGLSAAGVCVMVDGLCWVYRWNVINLSLLARA